MILLDGKATAAAIRAELKAEIETLKAAKGRAPGLHVILVGDDPASQVYVRNKIRACEEIGVVSGHSTLPADTPQDALEALIRALNADLETPITAELIYLVFEDSGYWQRHFMSLDETTNTRRLPTPGIVGKHTLNILAWGKGQTQAPPPPLIRYTAPPDMEPIYRRRTPAELEALRRQALDTLPEAHYARTA